MNTTISLNFVKESIFKNFSLILAKKLELPSLVIIPTYNEKENIEKMIRKVFSLQELFHVLIVDDGSPDGTAASVIQWTNHLSCADRVRVVSLPSNMGKGAAVKAGM